MNYVVSFPVPFLFIAPHKNLECWIFYSIVNSHCTHCSNLLPLQASPKSPSRGPRSMSPGISHNHALEMYTYIKGTNQPSYGHTYDD